MELLFIILFIVAVLYIILSICIDRFVHKETMLLIKKYYGCTRNGIWYGKIKEHAYLEQLSEDSQVAHRDKTLSRKLLNIEKIHNVSFVILCFIFIVYGSCIMDSNNIIIRFLFIFSPLPFIYISFYLFNKAIENEKKKIIHSLAVYYSKNENEIMDNKTNYRCTKIKRWFLILYILSSIAVLTYLLIRR